jgi:hypothetical protein
VEEKNRTLELISKKDPHGESSRDVKERTKGFSPFVNVGGTAGYKPVPLKKRDGLVCF